MSSAKITGAVILVAIFTFIMIRSYTVGSNKAWANFYRWKQSAAVLFIGFCLVVSAVVCVESWMKHFSSKDPNEKVDINEIGPTVITVILAMLFYLARWWKTEVAGMNNQEAGRWSRFTFFFDILNLMLRR